MILSIESSCDDSSIAITEIETKKLLFHKKISQELNHSKYGGVVPELAARLHATALPKILKESKIFFKDLKAIAVTNEPGLSVTLIEGVLMAKALGISLNLPLIAVNHLKGHIYSLFIEKESLFPLSALLISGGHTQIIEANSFDNMKTVAKTLDDSFGESFDKVSKMLNLGYPGGPVIEKLAKEGDENRFKFTIPLSNSPLLAFSYSGIKNQVRLQIEKIDKNNPQDIKDLCASFQKAATAHLIQKCKKYFKQNRIKDFAIVGGASQNLYVREKFLNLCNEFKINLHLAPLKYCSDNAAMIGRYAIDAFKEEKFTPLKTLKANPQSTF